MPDREEPMSKPKREYNRLRDVRVGLTIFEVHGGRNLDAQHDILYAGPEDGTELTPDEVAILNDHGWFIDEETESWAFFT